MGPCAPRAQRGAVPAATSPAARPLQMITTRSRVAVTHARPARRTTAARRVGSDDQTNNGADPCERRRGEERAGEGHRGRAGCGNTRLPSSVEPRRRARAHFRRHARRRRPHLVLAPP